jgi:pentatricopeptide repeat protein
MRPFVFATVTLSQASLTMALIALAKEGDWEEALNLFRTSTTAGAIVPNALIYNAGSACAPRLLRIVTFGVAA